MKEKHGTITIDDQGTDDPEITKALQTIADDLGYHLERGKITACSVCDFFECVCQVRRDHKKECRFLLAMTCPVEIECSAHGRGVCPECDTCTCEKTQ